MLQSILQIVVTLSGACMQRWLQDPAWAEEDKAGKYETRASHAVSEAERQALQQQPMFCFMTALKLHRWAELAYVDFGQKAAAATSGEASTSRGNEVFKRHLHGAPSDADAWADGETAAWAFMVLIVEY